MFHRDACHREIYQRNIRDKRLPREACLHLGDVKVEQDIVTFNEEDHEDTFVEEGPQIERGTVFLRDTCHREICKETVVTSGFRVKRVLTRAVAKWRKTL